MSILPEDNDRTVIRPASSTASTAGMPVPDDDEDTHALPQGTVLGEFELTKKIGEGGFSIVYTAQDQSLGRRVALKEYMPSSIAARKGRTMVSARSERHKDTFEAGLKSFINEAKLLAQFDHRSLVKVYRFWEANGTAYMIMPFYEGVTLKDAVQGMSQPPDEAWLCKMLGPLTEALSVIHAEHCYHRDIAPDNVLLLKDDDRPLLLDFGAARKVIGGMTQALTVILKPGYAPVEQYAESPDMKQGSWTDVYALAATVYWTITGKTPPPAVGRMLGDTYKPLVECAAGRYSDRFLQAIDRALIVRPEQRTSTILAFRQDIGLEDRPAAETNTPKLARVAPVKVKPVIKGVSPTASSSRVLTWGLAGTVVALVMAVGGWWAWQPKPEWNKPKSAPLMEPAVIAKPVTVAPPIAAPQAPPAVASAITLSPPIADRPPTVEDAPKVAERASVQTSRSAPHQAAKPQQRATATAKSNNNSEECGRVLQRISLGDSSPELMDRLKTLNCK